MNIGLTLWAQNWSEMVYFDCYSRIIATVIVYATIALHVPLSNFPINLRKWTSKWKTKTHLVVKTTRWAIPLDEYSWRAQHADASMFHDPIHCLFIDYVICLIDPHQYSLYCLASSVLFSCGSPYPTTWSSIKAGWIRPSVFSYFCVLYVCNRHIPK
jgi:hypothetical protein